MTLTELRELADRATPGPWWYAGDVESVPLTIASDPYSDNRDEPGQWDNDARYIAACSPEVIRALVDAIPEDPWAWGDGECYACGALLLVDADRHKPDCAWVRLHEVMP